jgi:ribosomal protein L3 glutamine methyltransferase
MSELFHTVRHTAGAKRPRPSRARTALPSVAVLIERGARRLRRARVFFGHGTDNARDEAAVLVLHALGLGREAGTALYRRRVGRAAQRRVRALLTRRIVERIPAAYLTGVAWFAGLALQIDARVLVPRSPLAELIERGFAPWVDAGRVRRVLDVGTGSGCIAIAAARALPRARVDAVDISPGALEVARANVRRHRLARRVRVLESDHFGALGGQRYDIIVANPPYVGARELGTLPAEYRHEPRLALAAGRAGLDSVRVILRQARAHLRARGVLIVEVGNTEAAVRRAYPRLPFLWLQFERGGGGVFLLTRAQLRRERLQG